MGGGGFPPINADIIVYGDGFAAVAAACKAAANAPGKSVALILPSPRWDLVGGIGTLGGQNFFDVRRYQGDLVQRGSFQWWYSQQGQFYSVEAMSSQLETDMNKYPNLSVFYRLDITDYSFVTNPYRITRLYVREIYRDTDGYVKFRDYGGEATAQVFIDASEEGRLTRLVNFGGTTGRYDWPAQYLPSDEQGVTGRARQQAATLMFKVTGVQVGGQNGYNDMTWEAPNPSGKGGWGVWGGLATYRYDPVVRSFNDTYGPQGYAIKPLNAAQNGAGSSEWWVNCLLIFNVDGRAHYRDRGTWRYPADKRSNYKEVDQAWVDARNFIKNTPAFLNALRRFGGFQNVQLVYDDSGNPVVGYLLYVRETVHMAIDSAARANGTENTNYQLTARDVWGAGSGPGNGEDQGNYSHRIGLAFYWMDINAYQFSDLRDAGGNYYWGAEVNRRLRPDWPGEPSNPVYVPYEALLTNYVANLLICGYAAGAASFAWAALRVLPNLCVLGDAAGVAAAYAVNNGKLPVYFNDADIANVQNILVNNANARLEK